jgi:hypothetical protein
MNRGTPSEFRRTLPVAGSRTRPSRIDFRSSIPNPPAPLKYTLGSLVQSTVPDPEWPDSRQLAG